MALAVVATADLASDFDVGVRTSGKITITYASLLGQSNTWAALQTFSSGVAASGTSSFNGPIGVMDGGTANTRAGFFTEVNASIIDFGLNFYQLTNFYNANPASGYQGGMLRIDGRSGQKLFQFLGSQGAAVVFSIDNSGNIIAAGTVTGDLTPATVTPTGLTSGKLADYLNRLDSYRYVKAINANSTTSAAGGFDGLIAFVAATNSPGSNAVRSLSAIYAPVGTGTTAGGDFETQLLSWLSTATNASPAGLGLSSSTSPKLADIISALRTSAIGQSS